jgi:hypothetical protein
MRIGPSFIKIGKAVLYPLEELEEPHIDSVRLQRAPGDKLPPDPVAENVT